MSNEYSGTVRKFGLILIVVLVILFIVSLPEEFLRFIPSPTGNSFDVIMLVLVIAIVMIFYKG